MPIIQPAAIWRSALPISLLPLFLTACNKSAEVRYRATAQVVDHGKLRQSSRVWSFKLRESLVPLASPYEARFRGEAIPIRLSDNRWLYVLLTGENGRELGTIPEVVFDGSVPEEEASKGRVHVIRYLSNKVGLTSEISCADSVMCPSIAVFDDIADPRTVTVLNRKEYSSIYLAKLKIEITKDRLPLTNRDIYPSFVGNHEWERWWIDLPLRDTRRIDQNSFLRNL